MLCIWWEQLGVVYYELLKPTEIITGDRYRTQLMRLSRALKDKRPQYNQRHDKVILQHDNARPHVAKVVKTYLEMGSTTPPAVFSRHCSLWLSLVSINDTRPGWPAFPVWWRSKKLDRFADSLKRPVFSTRDSYATRKMGESSGQRWTILWIINV